MKVVLDTNVFVASGFNPRSHSARIVDAARRLGLQLVWHETTRSETRRMLTRIPHVSWQAVEDLFLPENEVTDTLDLASFGFVTDPADRKFAALAELTDCPLVTNDDDLLSVRHRLTTPVLTPREFLESQQPGDAPASE